MNSTVKLALGLVALVFVVLLGVQSLATRAPVASNDADAVSLPVADLQPTSSLPSAPDPSIATDEGPPLTVEDIQREHLQSEGSLAEAAREAQATVDQANSAKGESPARGEVSFEAGAPMIDPTPAN